MVVSIPLTDDEHAAAEDGQAALDRLLDHLADTPTPAGPTPRALNVPATARLLPLVDVRQGGTLRTALLSECAHCRESVTVTAVTLMNALVDFARTGQISPLHCGMSLTEAEDLLGQGRPHPAILMKGPGIDGYPYAWGCLRLVVTQRAVSGIWINLWPGSTTSLPPLLLPGSESFEATVPREELIMAGPRYLRLPPRGRPRPHLRRAVEHPHRARRGLRCLQSARP
ncbi:hypothetical protein GCM10010372_76040 [Streptomyces tauricus]|nr:hypothetical protein GCM10010372_76040 [Streptomyces tauricus]